MRLLTLLPLLLATASLPSSLAAVCNGGRRLAQGCGGPFGTCCCQQVTGPPHYFTCCGQASLWCHFFDFIPPGIPGACPQPSLCLPVPEPCGGEGQPCCPPPSELAGDFACSSPALRCEGAAVDGSYDAFLDLQGGNATVPLENYGVCVAAR